MSDNKSTDVQGGVLDLGAEWSQVHFKSESCPNVTFPERVLTSRRIPVSRFPSKLESISFQKIERKINELVSRRSRGSSPSRVGYSHVGENPVVALKMLRHFKSPGLLRSEVCLCVTRVAVQQRCPDPNSLGALQGWCRRSKVAATLVTT
jgi:hypothetical protein